MYIYIVLLIDSCGYLYKSTQPFVIGCTVALNHPPPKKCW